MRSRTIQVTIDLETVRASAEHIRRQTGVRLIAMIKSDAYGLGARPVADALAGVADDFAYFSLQEAQELGRPGVVTGPPHGDPAVYRELGLRPAIGTREEAARFAGMRVAVHVDTGMQRFGCALQEVEAFAKLCGSAEAFTHAVTPEAVRVFRDACAGRFDFLHAAATSLLGNREAWLDGVRPGVALYRGAVRVTTRLDVVRATRGPVGYTGFEHPYVGVILAGYAHLLRRAPVIINGRRQRLLEVGMNSAFVSVNPTDRPGDEVVLLGDGLTEAEVGGHLDCREHEVLCRYCGMGQRVYVRTGVAAADRAG